LVCVDGSQTNLDQAMENCIDSNVSFSRADIATWNPDRGAPGVIFADQGLHLECEHDRLFPRLFSKLSEGGVLAVQMPRWKGGAVEDVLGKLISEAAPGSVADDAMFDAAKYVEVLAKSAGHLDIWATEYTHVLYGEHGVRCFLEGPAAALWQERTAQLLGGSSGAVPASVMKALAQQLPTAKGKEYVITQTQHIFIVAQKSGHGPTEGMSFALS